MTFISQVPVTRLAHSSRVTLVTFLSLLAYQRCCTVQVHRRPLSEITATENTRKVIFATVATVKFLGSVDRPKSIQ